MSDHNFLAFGAAAARVFLRSAGTVGSGSSAVGAIVSVTTSPARKRKTFLSSNSNDRVRRSLLRRIRFLTSIEETCRHWLLGNQLRIKVEHLARRQRAPNRDELRQ